MMEEEKLLMFRNRLIKVYRHRSRQARNMGVTCYRIYDHDLPEFPLCIELYGDIVYMAEYRRKHQLTEEQHRRWMETSVKVVQEVLGVAQDRIYARVRQRKAGRQGQYQKLDENKPERIVEENGLRFIINPADYLDTGLFLDHRSTRQMVREQSGERKVLNLFCYTGSFSVYAASGGAAEVVSIDLSKTYLDWAHRNMVLNGYEDTARYQYVQADVKRYLKTLATAYYDLIILDPPTFSNSQRMEDFLDIQRDHAELINDCLSGLSAQGRIYFSTNFRKFQLAGESIPASIEDITAATTPFDFAGKLERSCFLIQHKQKKAPALLQGQ